MADVFYSIFDGLPQLNAPEITPNAQNTLTTKFITNIRTTIFGFTSDDIDNTVRDIIITKAKLTNRLTEDLVKKYHESFMCLHKAAKKRIEELEKEIENLNNPLRSMKNVVEFKPKDMEVNPEILQYIIQAMNEGKSLNEVIPPELLSC